MNSPRFIRAILVGSVVIFGHASSIFAVDLFISEVMSSNGATLRDRFFSSSDWIEIFNPKQEPVDLDGWFLSDDPNELQKWAFPKVILKPAQFLMVFASGRDLAEPGQELHTNFKLSRRGEYLSLAQPNLSIVHEFRPSLPPLKQDRSYGVEMLEGSESLIAANAEVSYLIPSSGHSKINWTSPEYEETEEWARGITGIGYHMDGTLGEKTRVKSNSRGIYMRAWFDVEQKQNLERLILLIRYDDGFVAYLNGKRVLGVNAPEAVKYNSRATKQNTRMQFQDFDLSGEISGMKKGKNLLAVHCLNFKDDRIDMLLHPVLLGGQLAGMDPGKMVLLQYPTPGRMNAGRAEEEAGKPFFSHVSGPFMEGFELQINPSDPRDEIRYTVDGSMPGSGSSQYEQPLEINGTVMVRARCYRQDAQPGEPVSATYLHLDWSLLEFSSNLPVLLIENFEGGPIGQDQIQTAHMTFFEPGTDDRTWVVNPLKLETRVGIKERGASTASRGRLKKSYAVESRDEYDKDKDISPLGMPEDSDWILYAPYDLDLAIIRNAFAYEVSNQVGRYAMRTRFCEVFVNTDGGTLNSNDYAGVYVFMEKIKRGPNRVNVKRLGPEHAAEPEISGGYMLKIDGPDPGDMGFSAGSMQIMHVDPKENEITTKQRKWIINYIRNMYQSLVRFDEEMGYFNYIDGDSWIDHHILYEFTKNTDAFHHSSYFYKDRGRKMEYGPIWDFDRSMAGDELHPGDPVGWSHRYYYGWYGRLMANPHFKRRYIERWAILRRDSMSEHNMLSIIDSMAKELDEAARRNYEKWPLIDAKTGFRTEIEKLKDWISQRLAWIDSQYITVPPPNLSQVSGVVPPGFKLQVNASKGEVYYTLNGSDPRMDDYSPNPEAVFLAQGESRIQVSESSRIILRAREGEEWSIPVYAEFILSDMAALKITEIMYNPPGGRALEFIVFQNQSTSLLNLEGVKVEGVGYEFPGGSLNPWQVGVLISDRDPEAFLRKYPGANILGKYPGQLSNGGETLRIMDGLDQVVLEMAYGDSGEWPEKADGGGYSLEIIDPMGDPSDPGNWRSSGQMGGTPRGKPRIDGISQEQGKVKIRFMALPGLSYRLQYADDLISGEWKDLYRHQPKDVPETVEIMDSMADQTIERYYRLLVP